MVAEKWFDRNFAFDFGPEKYGGICLRLKTKPADLQKALSRLSEDQLVAKPNGTWSMKEQLGHLSVLEPVWRIRFEDIEEQKPQLTSVDLNNTATTEAGFNTWS